MTTVKLRKHYRVASDRLNDHKSILFKVSKSLLFERIVLVSYNEFWQ